MNGSAPPSAFDTCLAELSRAIAGLASQPAQASGSLDEAGGLLAGAATHMLGTGRAAAALLDKARTSLTVLAVAHAGGPAQARSRPAPALAHAPLFDALKARRTASPDDPGLGHALDGFGRAVFGDGDHRDLMAAGIFVRGELAGVICHEGLSGPGARAGGRRVLLASLADLAALALEARERDQERRARAESEERLATLLHSLPDQVCFKDARGRWLVANRAWLTAHGVPGEAYEGMTGAGPGPDVDLDGVPTALRLKTDAAAWILGSTGYCLVKQGPDGGQAALEVLKKAVGPPRQPRGLMVMARDVTSHRQALEELRASNAELEAVTAELQALNESLEERVAEATRENRRKDALLVQQSRMAAMGEMIGNIAHQWRQPLNSLGLLVTNMTLDASDGSLGEAQAQAYDRQCREILNSMSRTIDDFRNFFKPDKTRQDFPLDEPAREALSLVRASLAHQGIKVATDFSDAPRISGYRGEFSQVVLNLLANARDAVAASGRRHGRITLRTATEGGEAVLVVADDGGGVPEDAAPRVFDPYFTTKLRDKGTGLGLYISRRIIEDHMGGSIAFANKEGGAEFTVRLPLDAPVPGGEDA